MKTSMVMLCLQLLFLSGTPRSTCRVRQWNNYAAGFRRNADSFLDPTCLITIPKTLMFQGVLEAVYSYDHNSGICSVVLVVTLRQRAPNVFRSLEGFDIGKKVGRVRVVLSTPSPRVLASSSRTQNKSPDSDSMDSDLVTSLIMSCIDGEYVDEMLSSPYLQHNEGIGQ
uniref:Secreted protein n=1 Tax=Steinernema glaseri TaxID=37863 RepID=A0A1I7ZTW4_9BILA